MTNPTPTQQSETPEPCPHHQVANYDPDKAVVGARIEVLGDGRLKCMDCGEFFTPNSKRIKPLSEQEFAAFEAKYSDGDNCWDVRRLFDEMQELIEDRDFLQAAVQELAHPRAAVTGPQGDATSSPTPAESTLEFWINENIKSHQLGAIMAGLLTDEQNEELQRLRKEMDTHSLGDRPSSISAANLGRLIELEALERSGNADEITSAFNRHLAQRHEELATTMRETCTKAIALIEQYTRPDFYAWLLMDHAGQKSDPIKRATEAKELLQKLVHSKPGNRVIAPPESTRVAGEPHRQAAIEILDWLNFDTSLDAVQADVYGVWAIISKHFPAPADNDGPQLTEEESQLVIGAIPLQALPGSDDNDKK